MSQAFRLKRSQNACLRLQSPVLIACGALSIRVILPVLWRSGPGLGPAERVCVAVWGGGPRHPLSEANMKEKREKKGKRSPSDDRAAVKGSSSGAP